MKKLYGSIIVIALTTGVFFVLREAGAFFGWSAMTTMIVFALALVIMAFIDILALKLLFKRLPHDSSPKKIKHLRTEKRVLNIALTLALLITLAAGYIFHQGKTVMKTLTGVTEPDSLTGYVFVKKDSAMKDYGDQDYIQFGFLKEDFDGPFSMVIDQLDKQHERVCYLDYNPCLADSPAQCYQSLMSEQTDIMVISEADYETLKNLNSTFDEDIKCLEKITLPIATPSIPVDVTAEPFNVLLMGVDLRAGEGNIYTFTRTDTLIVASFNPATCRLLLVSIPRDSYVTLADEENNSDKITHAGLEGPACTVKTVENLLGIDINYYAKFNFNAMVDLVDQLGGIDVDVAYDFTEQDSQDWENAITVSKGQQLLNGEEALAYTRHRFTQNDHVRNDAQQQVLEAIIHRLISWGTLSNLDDLLKVLKNNMTTNMPGDSIQALAGMLPTLSRMEMTHYVLEGEDYETYVPRYDQDLWITDLDEKSVQKAQDMIQEIQNKEEKP